MNPFITYAQNFANLNKNLEDLKNVPPMGQQKASIAPCVYFFTSLYEHRRDFGFNFDF